MNYIPTLLAGLVLSIAIGVVAYRRGSLSGSGVLGAGLTGTLIFGLGGWVWGLTLITFFVSSSALSHYRENTKEALAEKFSKGHRRDLGQTLANGGLGAALAVAHAARPHPALFAAFLGAMAAVNADTWATELGVFNPAPPRLITSGRQVEVGTSGGVSRLGLLASGAGALVIGLAALLFARAILLIGLAESPHVSSWTVVATLAAGLAGSLVDSWLGASVQAVYYCPYCGKETEKKVHGCGTLTRQQRGWRWLDNDVVNLLSSVVGAGVAAALFLLV
jgi:uncharacterized protein (TIGR00297 family)